jgi:hypothetical protein
MPRRRDRRALRAGAVALALLGGGAILTRSAWPRPPGSEEGGALPPNASLEQVVEKIRSEKVVSSEHVGFAGQPSSVYAAFKRLSQVASEADLRRFTSDRSPALRVYAFYALADLHPDRVPFDALLSRVADAAPVQTIEGCVIGESVARDLMLARIESRLSVAQRTELLARLLDTNKVTAGAERALRFWTVEPRLYEALRERANGGLSAALPAIARFRRDADLALIERNLQSARFDALGAVAEFPSQRFLPALRNMQASLLPSSSFSLIEARDVEALRTELPSQTVDKFAIFIKRIL